MDANRFDTIARTLNTAGSRRGALAALLGGTVGLVGLSETDAKKKKGKGKKNKKKNKGGQGASPPPPPPAPAPGPCANGVKDGNETDIDCGGSCDRCATSRACISRQDCRSALCVGNTCVICQTNADCRVGGDQCDCRNGTCANFAGAQSAANCESCPMGTASCEPFGATVRCWAHCGSTF